MPEPPDQPIAPKNRDLKLTHLALLNTRLDRIEHVVRPRFDKAVVEVISMYEPLGSTATRTSRPTDSHPISSMNDHLLPLVLASLDCHKPNLTSGQQQAFESTGMLTFCAQVAGRTDGVIACRRGHTTNGQQSTSSQSTSTHRNRIRRDSLSIPPEST